MPVHENNAVIYGKDSFFYRENKFETENFFSKWNLKFLQPKRKR